MSGSPQLHVYHTLKTRSCAPGCMVFLPSLLRRPNKKVQQDDHTICVPAWHCDNPALADPPQETQRRRVVQHLLPVLQHAR